MALAVKKLKLRYSSPDAFFKQFQNEIVKSMLLVPTSKPPPVNTPVLLTLIIPEIPDPFVVQCRVSSSVDEKRAAATGRKVGITLRFNRGQRELFLKLQKDINRSDIYLKMLKLSRLDNAAKLVPDEKAQTPKVEAQVNAQEERHRVEKPQRATPPETPDSKPEARGHHTLSTAQEKKPIREAEKGVLSSTLTGEKIEKLREMIRNQDRAATIEKQDDNSVALPPPPTVDKVKREFSTGERERMKPVVEFILGLVKAMLRSGYYAPDHPGSMDAKEGIYNEFQVAVGDRPDLTLLNQESKQQSDVLISGILDDQVSLRGLIGSEQSSIFIPKFKEYFNRKSLVSFSMKKTLVLGEFNDFIDIMSDPKVDKGESGQVGGLLTNALIEKGISEVSTVFVDDMIFLEMKLPWRVEMAIQRLAKDLKVLPMFKGKSEEEIQAMKIRIVQDIVRPLREPHMLKDIVVNCHIIAKHVAVIEAEDLEQIIVKAFPLQILIPTSKYVFEELTKIDKELKEQPDHPTLINRKEGVKRILKWVSQRVVIEGIEGSEVFFEQLYFFKILKYEELPDTVKDHVNTLTLVKEFKDNPSFYMEKFNEAVTEDDVLLLIRLFRRIMPDLLEQEEYKTLSLIVKSVQTKFALHPRLSQSSYLPLQNPTNFIWEDSIETLEERFKDEKNVLRPEVEKIVELLESIGVQLLIRVLSESKIKSIRSAAVNVLTKMGDFAILEITNILKNHSNPWYLHRNALSVISKIGGDSEVDLVASFLKHSKPRVREEALVTLSSLMGTSAEPTLLKTLRDPNLRVRRRAVVCIGQFPLKSNNIIVSLSNILNMGEENVANVIDSNQLVELKAETINTLGLIGNAPISKDKRVEDLLLEVVIPDNSWLNKLSKKVKHAAGKRDENFAIQNAAIKALWKIGTDKALPILTTLAKKGDRSLATKAKEALTQIRLREKGQAG